MHLLGQLYLFESLPLFFSVFSISQTKVPNEPNFSFSLTYHSLFFLQQYINICKQISGTYQGQIFPLMASKHLVLILLLLIYLVPHLGNGAKYIIHRLTHHHKCHKNCHHHHESAHPPKFRFPPKNPKPVPPSGPSRRHNV